MKARYNLLIAEDDADAGELLRANIEKAFGNLKIFVAADGAKVLRALDTIEFDFLCLDMNLPKYDGRRILESLGFLKKQNRPPHVFIISAENTERQALSATGAKIHHFPKPVDFARLQSTIEHIMNPPAAPATAAPAAAPKAALDVKFMNPFIEATLNVLKVTTDTEAVKEEMNISKGETAFHGDISAFYPIQSPMFQGFFCISFPEATYLKLMGKMLYTEFTEINADNQDGVGELCNQIFGNAKAHFNDKFNTSIEMATPSITVGKSHKVMSSVRGPRVVVRFATELGHFFVEVSFVRNG